MVEFVLTRTEEGPSSTLGVLWKKADGRLHKLCWTLEDQRQDVKVLGETRIPAGRYRAVLADPNANYKRNRRYGHLPEWCGPLVLLDVPGFKGIEIHAGLNDDYTAGCILVGESYHKTDGDYAFHDLQESRDCFMRVYPLFAEEITEGEQVWIDVRDPE